MMYITIGICILTILMPQLGDYFQLYRHPNGIYQDRASCTKVFSCATAGFGMDALAIAASKGQISIPEAIKQINLTIDFYSRITPKKNRGWLFHFHDVDGRPIFNCEVSTVDTAIYYQGARQAAKRLKDKDLTTRVETLISAIDTGYVIDNGYFCHGWIWDNDNAKFLSNKNGKLYWDEYDESILIYDLFGMKFQPKRIRHDLPLFAYYYPLCFMKDTKLVDHLQKAIDHQLNEYGYVGITSTDTRTGYHHFPIEYISPMALYAITEWSEKAKTQLGNHNWQIHSIHLKSDWISADRVGIDEGATLLLKNRLTK